MAERAEFRENQNQMFGIVFLGPAVVLAVTLFRTDVASLNRYSAVLLLAMAAFAGVGLWCLSRLRRTGVVVVVDRDGLTDLRLMPEPIRWAEVARCALVTGMKGVRHMRLILRPDNQAAARLGKRKVMVNDLLLKGGEFRVRGGLRAAGPAGAAGLVGGRWAASGIGVVWTEHE